MRLEELDYLYKLKSKVTIESMDLDILSFLVKKNWVTAYTIPTLLLHSYNVDEINESPKKILRSLYADVQNLGIDIITFDSQYYNYVKTNIEPYLPNDINYYVYISGTHLNDHKFIDKLGNTQYSANDTRVKRLVISFQL